MRLFYLKIFLAEFCCVFMATAFACLLRRMAPTAVLLVSFCVALSVAAIAAFAAGRIHETFAKKVAGPGAGPEIYRLRQSAEVSINLEYPKLFTLAHHYLAEKAGCLILEADTRKRRILAKSPFSLKNMGSSVTLEFAETSPAVTGLKISSRPDMPLTLIDYGENLRIVLEAKNYLLQNAGTQ